MQATSIMRTSEPPTPLNFQLTTNHRFYKIRVFINFFLMLFISCIMFEIANLFLIAKRAKRFFLESINVQLDLIPFQVLKAKLNLILNLKCSPPIFINRLDVFVMKKIEHPGFYQKNMPLYNSEANAQKSHTYMCEETILVISLPIKARVENNFLHVNSAATISYTDEANLFYFMQGALYNNDLSPAQPLLVAQFSIKVFMVFEVKITLAHQIEVVLSEKDKGKMRPQDPQGTIPDFSNFAEPLQTKVEDIYAPLFLLADYKSGGDEYILFVDKYQTPSADKIKSWGERLSKTPVTYKDTFSFASLIFGITRKIMASQALPVDLNFLGFAKIPHIHGAFKDVRIIFGAFVDKKSYLPVYNNMAITNLQTLASESKYTAAFRALLEGLKFMPIEDTESNPENEKKNIYTQNFLCRIGDLIYVDGNFRELFKDVVSSIKILENYEKDPSPRISFFFGGDRTFPLSVVNFDYKNFAFRKFPFLFIRVILPYGEVEKLHMEILENIDPNCWKNTFGSL